MRALMVFGALVVTPFVAAVSQDRGAAATRAGDAGKCAVADSNRSTRSTETTRGTDPKARARTGCAPTTPAPTPPAPTPPPPADTAPTPPPPPATITISGNVFQDVLGRPGIAGWTVEVVGPVTVTAVTDSVGNYSFTGLPTGTYTVCEAIPMGWRQTSPPSGTSCPTGVGYSFTILTGGTGASSVNFGNLKFL